MTRRNFALGFIFLWFAIGGVAHFVIPEWFLKIVPPDLPLRMEAVYISGAFELLGAVGILIAKLRKAAGLGLFVLVIVVTPANIYMWRNASLFPDVPEVLLLLRLPLQVLLLLLIWWATWRDKRTY